jgi:hypothetical protein
VAPSAPGVGVVIASYDFEEEVGVEFLHPFVAVVCHDRLTAAVNRRVRRRADLPSTAVRRAARRQ